MSETKKAPVKKTGNKTTEIIIGASAAKLMQGIKMFEQATLEVGKLSEIAETNAIRVLDLEDKIGGLQQQMTNEMAQNKIEIKNQYETDKKSFVDQWLAENGVVVIESDELDNMRTTIAEHAKNLESAVKRENAIVSSSMTAAHNSEIKILKLEHEKKESDNMAQLKQTQNQITFLEAQVKHWQDALTAERTASVERAKASSIGTMNIGTGNGR